MDPNAVPGGVRRQKICFADAVWKEPVEKKLLYATLPFSVCNLLCRQEKCVSGMFVLREVFAEKYKYKKKGLRMMKRKNFTLIELLVAVAIIGILAGLLIPVLSSVRGKAQSINCVSNLKQNGMALAIYQMNHNNWTALNYYKTSGSTKTWSEFTFGKYNDPGYTGVLGASTRCPSVKHPDGVHQNHQQYIYGALGFLPAKDRPGSKFASFGNAFSTGGGSDTTSLFVLVSNLKTTSEFPMLADSVKKHDKYGFVQHYTFKHDNTQGALNLVHSNFANVLFADGHCSVIGKDKAYESGFAIYHQKGENHASPQ